MDTDSQLLRQYAQDGSEAAFAELVRRYVDLVYSVALRQANGDATLAQDVTQVVFVDLARKARGLADRATLAGWLHTSARFAAGKAIRGEQRRRIREQEVVTMNEIPITPAVDWEQLRPLLDESVGGLKQTDRDAILLRFYQGKSHQEVGAILGLSENSANKRIERALEKLRNYFTRRGVTTTSAILAATISVNSVKAAPVGLAEKVAPAALAGAGGTLAGATFLAGFLALLMKTKTKVLLTAVVLTLLALLLAIKFQGAGGQPSPPDVGTPPEKTAPVPPAIKIAPAQVAAPVVKPTVVQNTISAAPPAAPVEDPRIEVGTAMKDFVSLLESGNYEMAAGTYLQLTPDVSASQLVVTLQQNPDFPETVQMFINATKSAQSSVPVYNETGDIATYKLSPPTNGKTMVRWKKINGTWYVDAYE